MGSDAEKKSQSLLAQELKQLEDLGDESIDNFHRLLN